MPDAGWAPKNGEITCRILSLVDPFFSASISRGQGGATIAARNPMTLLIGKISNRMERRKAAKRRMV